MLGFKRVVGVEEDENGRGRAITDNGVFVVRF